jgi:hypothetical protein
MRLHRILLAMAIATAPATAVLTSSVAHAQVPPAGGRTDGLMVTGFDVQQISSLAPGNQLHFDVFATSGASITLSIDGATRGLQLNEVEPGKYAGTYTIGDRDRLRPDSKVRADTRLGGQTVASMLTKPIVRSDVPLQPQNERRLTPAAGAPGAAPPPPPRETERPRVARYCTSCAIVEKVEVIQPSTADARPLATEVRSRERYRVTVRFNTSDSTQAIEYDNNPGYRKGDRVRVNDGVLSLERD